MLGVTPKAFDAVDMIPRPLVHVGFRVIHLMMLPVPLQRLIATKAVRVIDRAFARPLANVLHQLRRTDMLHDFGVHTPFPLQQPENKAFAGCATATLAFAPTAKVCL